MKDDEVPIFLPPGFRFHPTDEELITHYLVRKIEDTTGSFSAVAIGEADMNLSEPWDLPSMAKMADAEEWYFFYERDRKYPTGSRTNRATKSGYWKATGRDKEIYSNNKDSTVIIGMKKTLVFYKGRAPKGDRTNWIMHEFKLQHRPNSFYQDDQWVVCRVFNRRDTKKNTLPPPPPLYSSPLQSDVITPVKSHVTGTTQSSSTSCSSYDNYNQYLIPLDYSNVGAYFQDNPTSNTPVFFNDLDEYSHNHNGGSPRSVATPRMIPRHCELAADQHGYSLPEQLMGSSSSNGSPVTTTEYYAGAEGHFSSTTPAPTMVDIHNLVNANNWID